MAGIVVQVAFDAYEGEEKISVKPVPVPIGRGVGGPPITEAILGPWLWAQVQAMKAALPAKLAGEMAEHPQPVTYPIPTTEK